MGRALREDGNVTGITSKIRAAVAAIGLLACASPLAAQSWHHRGRALRYEAVWLERSQAALRGPARWYVERYRSPAAVLAGQAWVPRRGWLAPRAYGPRRVVVVGPRGRWIARPWLAPAPRAWRRPVVLRRPGVI
jgi:hypothetical protein